MPEQKSKPTVRWRKQSLPLGYPQTWLAYFRGVLIVMFRADRGLSDAEGFILKAIAEGHHAL